MTATTHTKVLSTPSCVQCKATYRRLDAIGASYEILDGTDPANEALLERIRAHHLGATQAPFVIVDDDLLRSWTGYDPAKIDLHSKPAAVAA